LSNIKLYTVTHKAFNPPKDAIYVPIQVGKQFTGKELGFLSDDTGCNIAHKNKNYCELTALYWIWKNDDSDIVGLCHYRRYFIPNGVFVGNTFLMNEKQIRKKLSRYDAIVADKMRWKCSVRESYSQGEGKDKDFEKTREIIKRDYPEYLSSFDKIANGNNASYCNMIITRKEILDKYCTWLFDILEKQEKITDLTGYTPQQIRIYGYLSEILLNVWLEHNQLKTVEVPVVNTEWPFQDRLEFRAKQIVKSIVR